jgi:hypothetical protein
MRSLPCLLILCLSAWPAWAGVAGSASGRRAGQDVAVVRVRQELQHSRAHVAHLRQGVAKQESLSREAAVRLRQEDDTIAELERQLQALRTGRKRPGSGQ